MERGRRGDRRQSPKHEYIIVSSCIIALGRPLVAGGGAVRGGGSRPRVVTGVARGWSVGRDEARAEVGLPATTRAARTCRDYVHVHQWRAPAAGCRDSLRNRPQPGAARTTNIGPRARGQLHRGHRVQAQYHPENRRPKVSSQDTHYRSITLSYGVSAETILLVTLSQPPCHLHAPGPPCSTRHCTAIGIPRIAAANQLPLTVRERYNKSL